MPTTEQDIATLMERTMGLPQLVDDVTKLRISVQALLDGHAATDNLCRHCQTDVLPGIERRLRWLEQNVWKAIGACGLLMAVASCAGAWIGIHWR